MLKIDKMVAEGVLKAALWGSLDTDTAPGFEEEMIKELAGAEALMIDMEHLEYISSAGLRVLLKLHRLTAGKMNIQHVSEPIMDIFDVTGFSDILTIE